MYVEIPLSGHFPIIPMEKCTLIARLTYNIMTMPIPIAQTQQYKRLHCIKCKQ